MTKPSMLPLQVPFEAEEADLAGAVPANISCGASASAIGQSNLHHPSPSPSSLTAHLSRPQKLKLLLWNVPQMTACCC